MSNANLRRVVVEYVNYYNTSRPHQGIDQQTPVPPKYSIFNGPVDRKMVLGGIINDYYRTPARTALSTT